jgi:hypothetical protein
VSSHVAKANALLDHEGEPWAYEQARLEVQAAVAAVPDDDAVQVVHARWLRREGQLDAAKKAITAVRERSPAFEPAMVEEGELELERDCENGAERAHALASAAIELNRDDPRAWLLLSRIETRGYGPRDELVIHADKLRKSPDHWVAKQADALLADHYAEAERKYHLSPVSERCFLQALKPQQWRPDTRTHYAEWLLHRERYEEAAYQAQLALQIGAFVPAQQVLAVALRKQVAQSQPEDAKQLLQRSDEACEQLAKLGGKAAVCAH